MRESSSPITLSGTVANAPKGVKQTVQLKLNRTPPLNTAATIRDLYGTRRFSNESRSSESPLRSIASFKQSSSV